jgi:hypothetical protein
MTLPDLSSVQIGLTIALVVITGVYAWRTFAISKAAKEQAEATKNQADASVKMAEEMRLQRLTAKPVVVPDIDVNFKDKFYTDKMRDLAQSDFPVVITNVGTAAALELELRLTVPTKSSVSSKLALLLPGAEWRCNLTYVADFDKDGDPIFNMPPPEGLYEFKVTFRSATSQPHAGFSEVTLPFNMYWSGTGFYWTIERQELQLKLSE